jgi:hypothetical protein
MKKVETGLTRNAIIAELTKSEHGDLKKYLAIGREAAVKEPEFFAHLIAWDAKKGQIKDTHVALPVISLTTEGLDPEFSENALAHIASLRPREFLRAYRFSLDLHVRSRIRKSFNRLTADYLHFIEGNKGRWDATAVQHRRTLKELYALAHVKPSARAQRVLFLNNYPPNSVFEKIANLKNMSPVEAAGTILESKIPFLIAIGALGDKAKDTDLTLALIERMSPTELVTNTKMLEKLGVKTVPVLKTAFEEALGRAAKSKKATFKTARAAEQIKDESLKAKLNDLQEKQIQTLGGVDGNWLVLGDKSGSMADAIEGACHISATLAKMVKGQVSLVFFDTTPRFFDVTGKTYDQIKALAKHIRADGGTSIGCGLLAAIEKRVEIDGIAVVSDAAENAAPYFVDQYAAFTKSTGKEVPVYLYRCGASSRMGWGGDHDLAKQFKDHRLDLQEFDLSGGFDFYSLPNLVATMRTNRYSLADEILATPLLTLKDVLKEDANVS